MTARAQQPGRDQITPTLTKPQWRARLLAARRAIPAEQRAEVAAAIIARAVQLADSVGGPVCGYLPVGTEPGSAQLPEALAAAGHRVLLPVVPADPGPLDWAAYTGPQDLGPGPIGLREPIGPRLGPTAVAQARLILVPALAADRRGIRIGKGAGYYDRSLSLAETGVPLVVVIYDDELVDRLPAEPHDIRMTAALRPNHPLTSL